MGKWLRRLRLTKMTTRPFHPKKNAMTELAANDDPAAVSLVDEYAANLALGLVNVQQLFAPGLFVLHGEARDGGERRSRFSACHRHCGP